MPRDATRYHLIPRNTTACHHPVVDAPDPDDHDHDHDHDHDANDPDPDVR